MFWAAVVVGLVLVLFTVVQIGPRMGWRFPPGDEDSVSGDSFGWQLFGGRKRKAP